MFDTATELIAASLPAGVSGDPVERRIAVLRRLYARDCDDSGFAFAIDALQALSVESTHGCCDVRSISGRTSPDSES